MRSRHAAGPGSPDSLPPDPRHRPVVLHVAARRPPGRSPAARPSAVLLFGPLLVLMFTAGWSAWHVVDPAAEVAVVRAVPRGPAGDSVAPAQLDRAAPVPAGAPAPASSAAPAVPSAAVAVSAAPVLQPAADMAALDAGGTATTRPTADTRPTSPAATTWGASPYGPTRGEGEPHVVGPPGRRRPARPRTTRNSTGNRCRPAARSS